MSTALESVNIGGVDDMRFVLGNAQQAAVLDVGSTWNVLRIGVRFSFDDTGGNLTGQPRLYIGVLASPSAGVANGPLGTATSHFVGYRTDDSNGTWVRNVPSGQVQYTLQSGGAVFIKKINTTVTGVGTAFVAHGLIALPSSLRQGILIQITKGSPNFSMQRVESTGPTITDMTLAALRTGVEHPDYTTVGSGPWSGFGTYFSANATGLAVNEGADGALNSICVAWDRSTPALNISDILFTIFS